MSMATPYSTNTPADWGDDLLITGINGGPFPTFWESLLWYDETVTTSFDDGWTAPTHYTADNLVRGLGYYMYAGTNDLPAKIKMSGTVDLSNFTFPLSYTSTGNGDEDGWHLLGNPYPSPIDWDKSAGWARVGCCNSIWVWNECNEQFASYIDGSATNGGTNVVESSQAFWMKAHLPGASMTINRSAITTETGDFRLDPLVKGNLTFHIDGFSSSDEFVIRYDGNSSHGHDDYGDAVNMLSTETNMAMYTIDDSGMECSINSFPKDDATKIIPVMLRVPQTGSYTIDVSSQLAFPEDVCVALLDKELGNVVDIQSTVFYTFNMDSLPFPINRFDIILTYPVEVSTADVSCHGANDGHAIYDQSGVGPYDVSWINDQGQVVSQQTGVSFVDTLTGLGPGIYTLDIVDHGAALCNSQSVSFEIIESLSSLEVASIVSPAGCNNGNEGAVNISVYGGTAPYDFTWSNGEVSQDIDSLAPGTYSVTVEDASGCLETESFIVSPQTSVSAGFNVVDQSINLATGQTAQFVNQSVDATAYRWDFGDNSMNSVAANPVHLYDSIGIYSVTLYASNGPCADTSKFLVSVYDGSLEVEENEIDLNAYQSNGSLIVELELATESNVTISLVDAQGKMVKNETLSGSGRHSLNINQFAVGIYVLRVTQEEQTVEKKINLVR